MAVQVYKTHLVEGRAPAGPAVDSARANLAATFVYGFVNAGFGTDKLVTPEPVTAHIPPNSLCFYIYNLTACTLSKLAQRLTRGWAC